AGRQRQRDSRASEGAGIVDGRGALEEWDHGVSASSGSTVKRAPCACKWSEGAAANGQAASHSPSASSWPASTGTPEAVVTDDGWWTLHFMSAGGGWRTVLQLAPQAPFAEALLEAPATQLLCHIHISRCRRKE
ncbi:hypothetical protein ACEN88_34475, partial [Massilia sp. CT11-108]